MPAAVTIGDEILFNNLYKGVSDLVKLARAFTCLIELQLEPRAT